MKIKRKILLSVAISLVISLIIVSVVFFVHWHIANEINLRRNYHDIRGKIYALNLLIAKWPDQPNPSRIRQIRHTQNSVENLLQSTRGFDVFNVREEALLRQIRMNTQDLGYSLDKLIPITIDQTNPVEAEKYRLLVSQLWIKAQFISDDTNRLIEISQSQMADTQKKGTILTLALLTAMVLTNAAISFFSGRSIARSREKLHGSRERLSLAIEGAKMGMWELDLTSDHIVVSERFAEIFGVETPGERGNISDWLELIVEEDRVRIQNNIDNPKGDFYRFEFRLHRANDGMRRWVISEGRLQRNRQGNPVRMIGVVRDITEQKQAEEALWTLNETLEQQVVDRTRLAEARAKQIQALAVELIQAEEGERHRIAHLLHEDLQQILASARFQIQTALQTRAYEKILGTVDTLLMECIEKSRRLSYELSPPIMNQFELAEALKWLGRQMEKRFGMQVIVKGELKQAVDSSLKTFLFRAVQELLFNVAKHSGIKAAEVDFSGSDTHIIIKVSDHGRGFNPEILESSTIDTGLGLLSIRERSNYIGGSLKIESRPGQGSQITLTIPLGDSQ